MTTTNERVPSRRFSDAPRETVCDMCGNQGWRVISTCGVDHVVACYHEGVVDTLDDIALVLAEQGFEVGHVVRDPRTYEVHCVQQDMTAGI